jgi:tRNA(Ile)-lysidine synthase
MTELHPLVNRLRAHIDSTGIIPNDLLGLVGYSGGADSTFLVHALHQLGINIVAGHLHHGQRAEADEEMRKCEEFCNSIGVPFASGNADVPLLSKEAKIGIEEAGRRARYDFFHRASRRLNAEWIATAHTLDDQIETVLLNLTRGTGLSGLAGIPPERENIVRPILWASRKETRDYCIEQGLWFHDDPANSDPSYSRSRIRMNVVPELLEINASLGQSVSRLTDTVRQEDAFLDHIAAGMLERCESNRNGRLSFVSERYEAVFQCEALRHHPSALLRRGLRLATAVVGSNLDYDQTILLEKAILVPQSGSITTEGGVACIEWNEKEVNFYRNDAPSIGRTLLENPGITTSDSLGWQFTTSSVEHSQFQRERADLSAVIDSDCVKGRLFCRGMKPGDAFQPLGMKGTKKVSDLFNEAGLSPMARKLLPIVFDMVGIIWIPGVAMGERVKITGSTTSAIELKFGSVYPRSIPFSET